jgi:hypothetical protein
LGFGRSNVTLLKMVRDALIQCSISQELTTSFVL